MDIEYIREKIYHLDEQRKIQPGEYLNSEVIELLRQGNTTSRTACFAQTKESVPSKNVHLFPCEINCSSCGGLMLKSISKTHLLNYLQGIDKIICDDCQNKIIAQKEKDKEIALIEKERLKQTIVENTNQYIIDYLTPNKMWDNNILPIERTRQIVGVKKYIDYTMVANHIKSMSYSDFLNTPYWAAISDYKKFKSNYKCALCGSKKDLATHHKSYERHGYEHERNVIEEDLIVLCKDCHSKFHDKI